MGLTVDATVAVGAIDVAPPRPRPPGTKRTLPNPFVPGIDEALAGTPTEADLLLPAPPTDEPRGAKELLPRAPGEEPEPPPPTELGLMEAAAAAAAAADDFSNRDFPPTTGFVNLPFPRLLDAGRAGVGVVVPSALALLESPPGFWKRRLLLVNPLGGTEEEEEDEEPLPPSSVTALDGRIVAEVRFLGENPEGRLLLAKGVMAGAVVFVVLV